MRPRIAFLPAPHGAPDALQAPLTRTDDFPDSGATLLSNGGTRAAICGRRFGSGSTPDAYATRSAARPAPLIASRKRRRSGRSPGGGPSWKPAAELGGWAAIFPQGIDPGLLRSVPPTTGRGSGEVRPRRLRLCLLMS